MEGERISFIQDKLEPYVKGFHLAYQRCSREVKRFQPLAHNSDGLAAIRARISSDPSEKVDEFTINMCLNVTVSVGKELAEINIPTVRDCLVYPIAHDTYFRMRQPDEKSTKRNPREVRADVNSPDLDTFLRDLCHTFVHYVRA